MTKKKETIPKAISCSNINCNGIPYRRIKNRTLCKECYDNRMLGINNAKRKGIEYYVF